MSARRAIVIGGGPAGLMAAEQLCAAGLAVDVYDAMPSIGRKFLLAGKGGLNLTHGEPRTAFQARYAERSAAVGHWLDGLDGPGVRAWAQGLGVDTFVGSSGRVFPLDLKAAPLLRAWLHRLRESGVRFHMRHRWIGVEAAAPGCAGDGSGDGDGRVVHSLRFAHAGAQVSVPRRANEPVVLALGGASWPQLGSDGAWCELLPKLLAGVPFAGDGPQAREPLLAPLQPANCGFDLLPTRSDSPTAWSPWFAERFAGQPVKPVMLHFCGQGGGSAARVFERQGEFVITASGVEGSLIYAASSLLRDELAEFGSATIELDLLPDHSAEHVTVEVARPRGARSLGTHLKSRLGLHGLKAGLLHELLSKPELQDPATVARTLKRLPLRLRSPRPLAEAISTAGGVRLEALTPSLMLPHAPGWFCAGEMLDWEAPTGGYLLTACLASGRIAGEAAVRFAQS